MSEYTLWVAGSRTFHWWTDEHIFDRFANEAADAFGGYPTRVVHGGAKGIDRLADQWAHDHQLEVEAVLPDWDRYGDAAGPKRNRTLCEMANRALIIWDGKSRGTRHSINLALQRGMPMVLYVLPELAKDPNEERKRSEALAVG